MHPPYHLSGMEGVGDRAYPWLVPGPISLNIIFAAAHFIASGLSESIWYSLKATRRGYNNFKNQIFLSITNRVPGTINLIENNYRPG